MTSNLNTLPNISFKKLNKQIDRSIFELKIKSIILLKIKSIFQFKNKYIVELKNKSLIKHIDSETKSEKIYNDKIYTENHEINNLIIKEHSKLLDSTLIINVDNYKDIINKLNMEEPYLITDNDYQKLNDDMKSIYDEVKYEYIYNELDLSIPFNWHDGPYYMSKIKIYNYYKNKNIQNFIDNLHKNDNLKNSILQYITNCDTINNIYYSIISDDTKINYYPYKFIDIDNKEYELTNEIKNKVMTKVINELTNNIICKLQNKLKNNELTHDELTDELLYTLIDIDILKKRLNDEFIDEIIPKNKILIINVYKIIAG